MAEDLFDIDAFASADTAEMVVEHPVTGEPTTWRITFAGPAHPATTAQADRLARESLREARERETAVAGGRRYRPIERSPEDNRRRNAEFFADRMLGWTPVRINGGDFEFSREAATKLLIDPKYFRLYQQVMNFLADERSFVKRAVAP